MHRRHLSIAFAAAVLALVAATALPASNLALGPLVQVSGATPFMGCTLDNVSGQSGTAYISSEVEPWIDVNPANADNMIGVWQQDRWSNGGSRGNVAGVTMNGGASWTIVNGLQTSLCTGGTAANGGDYQRATDPWVTFGPTGIAYQLSLSFNDAAPPFTAFDFDHALLASRSTNGGLTWSDPVRVIRDTAPTVFNDKQTITADPTNPNFVYAAWDRLVFPGSERASVVASFQDQLVQRAVLVRTVDERRRDLGAGPADLRPRSARPDDRKPDRRSAERNACEHLHRVQQREREGPKGRLRSSPTFDGQGLDVVWAFHDRATRCDRGQRPGDGRSGPRREHHPGHRG
jgi:hypothetical protein